MILRRGDVYWAELKPRSGSEQSGRRPVVVVSHEVFSSAAAWRSIIVVPLSTSEAQRGRALTVVELPRGIGGGASARRVIGQEVHLSRPTSRPTPRISKCQSCRRRLSPIRFGASLHVGRGHQRKSAMAMLIDVPWKETPKVLARTPAGATGSVVPPVCSTRASRVAPTGMLPRLES